MTSQEYILSVLKLPFSDEDKAAMIVKLVDAGIKAGVSTVSDTTIGKAPTVQAQPAAPVVAPDLIIPKPVVAPQPPPPIPGITFHAENGLRVDDIVPQGTPGTVYLPVTGNVVSLPMMDRGELALGYLNRVKGQLHATDVVNRAQAAIVIYGWGPTAQAAGLDSANGAHWPEIADRLCNAEKYETPEQKERARIAREQMIGNMQNVAAQQGAVPVPPPPSEGNGDTVPVQFDSR